MPAVPAHPLHLTHHAEPGERQDDDGVWATVPGGAHEHRGSLGQRRGSGEVVGPHDGAPVARYTFLILPVVCAKGPSPKPCTRTRRSAVVGSSASDSAKSRLTVARCAIIPLRHS